MNRPQPIQTPAVLRRNLRRYLKGESSPQVQNAVLQAEKAGIDIHEFALKGRTTRRTRKVPRVPKAVLAQSARIAYWSILLPEAERQIPDAWITTQDPMTRKDFAYALGLPFPGRIYDLIAPTIKDEDEARLIAYGEPTTGGFSPTFRPPRTWGDSTTYGRGGCPPGIFNPWLPDSFLDDHVEVEGDPAFGVHLAWQSFWTRDSLERKPKKQAEVEEPKKVEEPAAASILSIFD